MIRRRRPAIIVACSFVLLTLVWTLPGTTTANRYQPEPYYQSTPHFECSRHFGDKTKTTALNVFSKIVHFASIDKLKIKGGNSNRENAWAKLAEFFVPLPQWRRAEVVLQYCGEMLDHDEFNSQINYMDTDLVDRCLHLLFNDPDGKGIGRLKRPNMLSGLLLQMYDTSARMFQLLIKSKARALGELLFDALEPKVHLETVYEIVLARPKTELFQLMVSGMSTLNAYPFQGKLAQIYKGYNFDEPGEERSLLEVHLELKIEKERAMKNEDLRRILQLLLTRLQMVRGRLDFYDQDMEDMFEQIRDNCACPHCGTKLHGGAHQLVDQLELLLTRFDFKSEGAFKFGAKFHRAKCDEIMEAHKVVVVKKKQQNVAAAGTSPNPNRRPWSWKRSRGNNHQQQQQITPAVEEAEGQSKGFSQFYWDQLRLMLSLAGLTAHNEQAFHSFLAKRLQQLHLKGDNEGVIRFLVLHLGDDLAKILAEYPGGHKQAEKDLTTFYYFTRLKNRLFDFAYRNILANAWDNGHRKCYTETEREYSLYMAVTRMDMEISKFEKMLKLAKILVTLANSHNPPNSDAHQRQCVNEEKLNSARKYMQKEFFLKTTGQLNRERIKLLDGYARELRRHLHIRGFVPDEKLVANYDNGKGKAKGKAKMFLGDDANVTAGDPDERACLLRALQEDFENFSTHRLPEIERDIGAYLGVEKPSSSQKQSTSLATTSTNTNNNRPAAVLAHLFKEAVSPEEQRRKEMLKTRIKTLLEARPGGELVDAWFYSPEKGVRETLKQLELICQLMREVLVQGKVNEKAEIMRYLYAQQHLPLPEPPTMQNARSIDETTATNGGDKWNGLIPAGYNYAKRVWNKNKPNWWNRPTATPTTGEIVAPVVTPTSREIAAAEQPIIVLSTDENNNVLKQPPSPTSSTIENFQENQNLSSPISSSSSSSFHPQQFEVQAPIEYPNDAVLKELAAHIVPDDRSGHGIFWAIAFSLELPKFWPNIDETKRYIKRDKIETQLRQQAVKVLDLLMSQKFNSPIKKKELLEMLDGKLPPIADDDERTRRTTMPEMSEETSPQSIAETEKMDAKIAGGITLLRATQKNAQEAWPAIVQALAIALQRPIAVVQVEAGKIQYGRQKLGGGGYFESKETVAFLPDSTRKRHPIISYLALWALYKHPLVIVHEQQKDKKNGKIISQKFLPVYCTNRNGDFDERCMQKEEEEDSVVDGNIINVPLPQSPISIPHSTTEVVVVHEDKKDLAPSSPLPSPTMNISRTSSSSSASSSSSIPHHHHQHQSSVHDKQKNLAPPSPPPSPSLNIPSPPTSPSSASASASSHSSASIASPSASSIPQQHHQHHLQLSTHFVVQNLPIVFPLKKYEMPKRDMVVLEELKHHVVVDNDEEYGLFWAIALSLELPKHWPKIAETKFRIKEEKTKVELMKLAVTMLVQLGQHLDSASKRKELQEMLDGKLPLERSAREATTTTTAEDLSTTEKQQQQLMIKEQIEHAITDTSDNAWPAMVQALAIGLQRPIAVVEKDGGSENGKSTASKWFWQRHFGGGGYSHDDGQLKNTIVFLPDFTRKKHPIESYLELWAFYNHPVVVIHEEDRENGKNKHKFLPVYCTNRKGGFDQRCMEKKEGEGG